MSQRGTFLQPGFLLHIEFSGDASAVYGILNQWNTLESAIGFSCIDPPGMEKERDAATVEESAGDADHQRNQGCKTFHVRFEDEAFFMVCCSMHESASQLP